MLAIDPPPYPVRTILLLDDDEAAHAEYRDAVAPRTLFATGDPAEALAYVRDVKPDVALVDLWLGATGRRQVEDGRPRPPRAPWGIDVIASMRRELERLVIVLVTGGFANAYRDSALAAGANAAVPKQFVGPAKIIAGIEHGFTPADPRQLDPMTLRRAQYEQIARSYVVNDRNATKTADDFGIARSSVYRTLRGPTPER